MVFKCCNPYCSVNFYNLYEGEWILIDLPDRIAQCYWLCGECAPSLCVVYDPMEGVAVVSKSPIKKSPGREALQGGESPNQAA